MAWIRTIGFDEATGRLRSLYDRLAGGRKSIDNILTVHSLRPHTLSGHLALYKSVLHHTGNHLPVWFLECVGILVSRLNGCFYCEAHHAEGLRRLLANDEQATLILDSLRAERFDGPFNNRQVAALRYAVALTNDPSDVGIERIDSMRSAGMSDGEILEVNQVVAYFAYANRTVNGLGVTTDGDDLGLSPSQSDDLQDWQHG